MKAWVFYVVVAWQLGPLAPVEHKTFLLQFDSLKECLSVADQVDSQVKKLKSIFHVKRSYRRIWVTA